MNIVQGFQRRLASARLLQLASQSLPTGSYAYSGGMESVIHLGWVKTAEEFGDFLEGLLEAQVGGVEIPYAVRIFDALIQGDAKRANYFSACLRASRESRELREQDGQMGRALARVLVELCPEDCPRDFLPLTYAEALAKAACLFQLAREDLALVLAYSWVEQHVMAVARLLPLGPVASQKLMHRVIGHLDATLTQGLERETDEIAGTSPLLGIASAHHEQQYTRIFRS